MDSAKSNYQQVVDDYFAKNTPPALHSRFYDWVETADLSQSRDTLAEELVGIVEEFLPKSHDTNPYDWNKCLETIRRRLR